MSEPGVPDEPDSHAPRTGGRVIAGLVVPFFSLVFHLSTFVVAVPTIREEFSLAADTTSWLLLVFTLPYILFMPFFGRLADRFGARTLMTLGVSTLAAGSFVCVIAPSMQWVFVGRFIQAAGAASINPLSLSIITRYFPAESRARAMGTWNAAGPFTGTIGPIIGGVLIESFGWRSIFVPVAVIAIIAVPVLRLLVPEVNRRDSSTGAGRFDWLGMVLTAAALCGFVFYVSSRPVTGRAAFTDWRLLALFVVSGVGWWFWELSRHEPFVAIWLFARRRFSIASISVSIRMFYLGTVNFLVPLYATDVLEADASATGIIVACNALALLVTMRIGGSIADRFSRKMPIVVGIFGQGTMLGWLALAPGVTVGWLILPVMLHGALAGLSLAALHYTAMHEVPESESGAGAGTYSMSRFVGSMLGASLMGVVLEFFLGTVGDPAAAYRWSFLVAAVVGIAGSIPALFLDEPRRRRDTMTDHG